MDISTHLITWGLVSSHLRRQPGTGKKFPGRFDIDSLIHPDAAMDPFIFFAIYSCMSVCYALACMAALMGNSRWGRYAGGIGLALNLLIFILIVFSAHRLPIFGDFESVTTIILVLGFLHLLNFYCSKPTDRRFYDSHAKWIYVSILLLLTYLAFFPKTLNPDFYMYDDIKVIVFFHFRILAFGVFIYSALILCAALYHGFPDYIHMGRNFLLTGAAIFLISEFSGSLWCLDWYGDFWHWSKGFLKAACLFLAAILACHIPPNWNLSNRMRAVIGSMPAAGSLWLLFLH